MPKITVETKVPLTSGKHARLTMEDGVVEIRTPPSFKMPKVELPDLRAAVDELEAAQLAQETEEKLRQNQDG